MGFGRPLAGMISEKIYLRYVFIFCFRCFLIYLPCICLSVSLISLYRKSEGYPGPLVETETQPLDKKRRNQGRGHRRNPSGLPEVTHSRALPPVPGEMVAERAHSRYRDTSATRNMEPPR